MTSRSLAAVAALGAALAAMSCGYPTFVFDPKGTGGAGGSATSSAQSGSGGMGSASSSAESSATSSASAGAGTGGAAGCALDHLVISEIRTRGKGGATDELIELYNPTSSAIALNDAWVIESRSATATMYGKRWQGAVGKSVPAGGHYLITGAGYTQAPVKDDALIGGITDAGSLRLTFLTGTIDAVCYSFDMATLADLTAPTFTCEGDAASNQPHDDSSSAQSNIDASLERQGQGCLDDGSSAMDFKAISPAHPENVASPLVP
jgi:hypothetical protein